MIITKNCKVCNIEYSFNALMCKLYSFDCCSIHCNRIRFELQVNGSTYGLTEVEYRNILRKSFIHKNKHLI